MTLILVIDDDHAVRTAARAVLECRGMDVVAADSGATGIRHLETFAIDLAIVDICVPDIDGLEIIRTFSQWTPRVPVIAMSAFLSCDRYRTAPDFLRMAGGLGAAFCLRKPFRPHQLAAAVEACLGAPGAAQGHDVTVTSTGERIGGQLRQPLHLVARAIAIKALES
jgi:CheY-like chemotaxis protein